MSNVINKDQVDRYRAIKRMLGNTLRAAKYSEQKIKRAVRIAFRIHSRGHTVHRAISQAVYIMAEQRPGHTGPQQA